jgi:capsular polysaccharide biosynthesis protein
MENNISNDSIINNFDFNKKLYFLLKKVYANKSFIIIFVLASVILTAIYSFILDEVYRATSVVLLSPPAFRGDKASDVGELAPESLSVKTYREILLSDSILDAVRIKANLKNDEGHYMALNDMRINMSAKIDIIQETSSGIKFSPAIQLIVKADTPKKAADIANVWSDISVERAKLISKKSKEGSISFLSTEFNRVDKDLKMKEMEFKTTQDKYNSRIDNLKQESDNLSRKMQDEYDQKITELMIETEKLYKDYDVESYNLKKKLIDDYDSKIAAISSDLKVELKKKELITDEEKISEFEKKLSDVQNNLKTLTQRLQELDKEIKEHPQLLVLAKAITDDSLWNKIMENGSKQLPDELKKLKLVSEELNPIYEKLMTDLTATKVDLNTAKIEEESLKGLLKTKKEDRDKLNKEILEGTNKIESLIREKDTETDKLDRDREAGSKQLKEERETKFDLLQREAATEKNILDRERKVIEDNMTREKTIKCDSLQRDVDNFKAKHLILGSKYQNAQITDADETPDIRKISDAVIPDQRIFPNRFEMVVTAFFTSLAVAILLVYLSGFLKGMLAEITKNQV